MLKWNIIVYRTIQIACGATSAAGYQQDFFTLQIDVATNAKNTIGAGEAVLHGGRDHAVLVLGIGLEVGSLHLHVVCQLVVEAEAVTVRVDHERHVVHVLIGQAIAGQLSASRNRQTIGDVPLCTSQILHRVVIQ